VRSGFVATLFRYAEVNVHLVGKQYHFFKKFVGILFLFQLNDYLGAKFARLTKLIFPSSFLKPSFLLNPPLKRHLKIKWMSGCLSLILLVSIFKKNYETH